MQVLFDVDGVLIPAFRFRALLESEYGIGRERTRPFFETRFPLCARGEADLVDELPSLVDALGWPGSPTEFLALWLRTENEREPATFKFVQELRRSGFLVHVASNQERHRAKYITKDMGFERDFDRLFFSCDLGVGKPDPEYFRRIVDALGVDGSDLLFLDEAMANVAAARREGWNAVRFEGSHSLNDARLILDGSVP